MARTEIGVTIVPPVNAKSPGWPAASAVPSLAPLALLALVRRLHVDLCRLASCLCPS
ncbi:putative leader peptide [Thermomonospora echinospora]|uniref:putative leader peptide n=1 Tax=Thermomonospora echinospora TaxID=1992 RepID=UPI00389AAE19